VRDLFIVSRGEPELYEYLRRRFAGREDVEVIMDRRVADRRHEALPHPVERRRQGRPHGAVEEDIRTLGFAVVLVR
jgi:hypothetical protein